jgi:excisionase family DNA binding protein
MIEPSIRADYNNGSYISLIKQLEKLLQPHMTNNEKNPSKNCTTKSEPTTRLLNAEQAAIFLDLALGTVYQKSSKGELPVYKVGRKIYFDRLELENLILNDDNKKLSNEELAIAALNYSQN